MATARGVGIYVADFHTGNHLEDGFMPLETIRRLLVVIGRDPIRASKGRPSNRRGGCFIKPPVESDVYIYHLGWYPTSACMFDDPILFLAGLEPSWESGQQRPPIIVGGKEMGFKNFIYTEDDDDLAFLPKEPSPGFGTGSPSASVNTKLPKDAKEPEISSLTADVKEHKCNLDRMMPESQNRQATKLRMDEVSKVIPYAAMELVHCDELGRLVGTLVSSTITYGRCRAYEQLDEFIADATALIEAWLLKKPPTLQKPAPSRTKMLVPSS
nr:hypothetical protein [Tanacetum cinerariifolium]